MPKMRYAVLINLNADTYFVVGLFDTQEEAKKLKEAQRYLGHDSWAEVEEYEE